MRGLESLRLQRLRRQQVLQGTMIHFPNSGQTPVKVEVSNSENCDRQLVVRRRRHSLASAGRLKAPSSPSSGPPRPSSAAYTYVPPRPVAHAGSSRPAGSHSLSHRRASELGARVSVASLASRRRRRDGGRLGRFARARSAVSAASLTAAAGPRGTSM